MMVRLYDGGMMADAQWHRDGMIVQGKYVGTHDGMM
jgi:hypothetical protein